MSAGLEASTVTPGSTAPDASFTTPLMVACADATTGSNNVNANAAPTLPILATATLRLTWFPRIDSSNLRAPSGPAAPAHRHPDRVPRRHDAAHSALVPLGRGHHRVPRLPTIGPERPRPHRSR